MEEDRRDFLFEVFDSQSTVLDPENISGNLDTGTFEWQGTASDDKISTFNLYKQNPSYNKFKLIGGAGDDELNLSIMSRNGADYADGGDGDDWISISSFMTNYARAVVLGGNGTDRVYFPGGSSPLLRSDGTPDFRVEGTLIEVRLTDEEIVSAISIDTEIISFGGGGRYLTEDIYNGRIRTVDSPEVYARTYGDNSDWHIKGLDTYSEYHSDALEPTPDPTPTLVPTPSPEPNSAPIPIPTSEPAPEPEPASEPEPYDGIIESVRGKGKLKGTNVADAFTFDSFDRFTQKAADKIVGFDASEGDTIAVSQYAFPALKGTSKIKYASTNKMKRLKLLSKQDYDFVYFKKKGRLYFDGNDRDNNWGDTNEGGLVAVLKGKPELSSEDLTLLV